MTPLNKRDRELVALGAAVGSNCVPCVVFHVREARDCGLTDSEIMDAVESANKTKRVPAELVLNAAHQELNGDAAHSRDDAPGQGGCGCRT